MCEIKVDEALRKGKISVQQALLDNEVVSKETRRRPTLQETLERAAY